MCLILCTFFPSCVILFVLQELQPNVSESVSRPRQKRPSSNKLVIVSDDEDIDELADSNDCYQPHGKCFVKYAVFRKKVSAVLSA